MSQRVVTDSVNTNIPGSYPDTNVISNPVGLGASGNIVIIGEADGGESYQTVDLKNNYFTPDQADKAALKYLSGPIVDAIRALADPSADADIKGTANRIYVVKTNQGNKAQANVDTDYGVFKDKNWGAKGNLYKVQVTSTQVEVAPMLTGTVIPTFGAALNGLEFGIRLGGVAQVVVTLSATSSDHNSIGTLIAEINAQLPVGIVASQAGATNALVLTVAVDSAANRKGYGKSFELAELHAGDLAALGLQAGVYVSSAEPAVEVTVQRADIGASETLDVSANVALTIGYLGTSGTLTINQTTKMLTTTVVGGAGANLSIDMTQFATLSNLAAYIAAQVGYSASVVPAAQQLPYSALDVVTTLPIATSVSGNQPGRVKMAEYNFSKVMATGRYLDFSPTAHAGLPAAGNAFFLANGAKGKTLAADIIAALDKVAGIQCNIIVPLFSRDASQDITEGDTDSASTYTIDAIHAAVKNHCIQFSTPKLKRNRIAILSYDGSYLNAKSKSQTLGHFRISMTMQRVSQVDSTGVVQVYLPWYAACVAAGMQAGGFYKALVNKAANVISFVDPSGYDSGSPGDVEDALDAGLLVLAQDTSRNYWVSDQTTYGFDTNFVYNSLQAVYLSDILVLDLTQSLQLAFCGKSLADVDAATVYAFIASKMDGYKKLKMIAGSDDAPLGYKNVKVKIFAPEMDVSVEIKLATAIYFIPLGLNISAVQQAA